MSVDDLFETPDDVCGCLGCSGGAFAEVDHPEHGRRIVCEGHANGHEVIRYV